MPLLSPPSPASCPMCTVARSSPLESPLCSFSRLLLPHGDRLTSAALSPLHHREFLGEGSVPGREDRPLLLFREDLDGKHQPVAVGNVGQEALDDPVPLLHVLVGDRLVRRKLHEPRRHAEGPVVVLEHALDVLAPEEVGERRIHLLSLVPHVRPDAGVRLTRELADARTVSFPERLADAQEDVPSRTVLVSEALDEAFQLRLHPHRHHCLLSPARTCREARRRAFLECSSERTPWTSPARTPPRRLGTALRRGGGRRERRGLRLRGTAPRPGAVPVRPGVARPEPPIPRPARGHPATSRLSAPRGPGTERPPRENGSRRRRSSRPPRS